MTNSSNYKYNPRQDYCKDAINFQSIPSYEQYGYQHPNVAPQDYDTNRANTMYSCCDNYKMGGIQDNQIYISTTDGQHDQIVQGKHVDAQGGLSGYFSDQATVDACKNSDTLDNTTYNEMCQIAPYRYGGINGVGDATYKPHVDCFDIDREALYNNYGTYDFNAAISKCDANNQFGAGGGNQGYNPHISEMIDNGTLKHNPSQSYSSNEGFCASEHKNPNSLSNSIVDESDYKDMMMDAQTRAQDCVKNNTPHPSEEACKNGFEKNLNPIESNTGNATIKEKQVEGDVDTSPPNKSDSNGYGEEPPQDESSENNAEQQNVDGTQDGSFGQEPNQAGEDSEQQKNANSEENDNGNGETADNEQKQNPEVTDQHQEQDVKGELPPQNEASENDVEQTENQNTNGTQEGNFGQEPTQSEENSETDDEQQGSSQQSEGKGEDQNSKNTTNQQDDSQQNDDTIEESDTETESGKEEQNTYDDQKDTPQQEGDGVDETETVDPEKSDPKSTNSESETDDEVPEQASDGATNNQEADSGQEDSVNAGNDNGIDM